MYINFTRAFKWIYVYNLLYLQMEKCLQLNFYTGKDKNI